MLIRQDSLAIHFIGIPLSPIANSRDRLQRLEKTLISTIERNHPEETMKNRRQMQRVDLGVAIQ